MSVISCKEIHTGRSASRDEKGERQYTRVFRVVTDNPEDGPATAGNADGIPRPGDRYFISASEFDLSARVSGLNPRQSDNPRVWEVQVDYSTRAREDQENPFDRPPDISWSFAQFSRIAARDVFGHGIVNSAGQVFDPPLEIDDSRPVLRITRNERFFNASLAIDYQDAINSDSFLGFAPGQAKVANISSDSQFEQDLFYWKTSYEFHFRREGWVEYILDQGRYELKVPEGSEENVKRHVPIRDNDGNPVSDPVPLDGNGLALSEPNPSKTVFLPFRVYKERSFRIFRF